MIQQFDNENYIHRTYPIAFPVVDIVIEEDGQQIVLGDTTITFYLAPGHTHDGIFTVIEQLGLLIAGDYLSDFELPFISHSTKAYEETLRKAIRILETHAVSVLVPGHGQTTSSEVEMKRRIQMSQQYLSRLITAVIKEDSEAMVELEKEMPFPSDFTKQCHVENIAITQQEYTKKK
jgi:hydroxyacylglutathione hydrolase